MKLSQRSKTTDGDEIDPEMASQLEAATKDIRSLMPGHMPAYLRIDKDIKEGLVKLSMMTK